MPAPTNISALTAVDLGTSYPASVSQQVDDAGTTYTVWYKFTAIADGVVGFWAFGDLVTYQPRTRTWLGPAGAPTAYVVDTGTTNRNKPVQIPVTSGTEYFVQVVTNAGNPSPANLTVSLVAQPDSNVPIGAIAVNDDSEGFPLVLVSTTTGEPLKFIQPFPNGESGDVLNSGISCVEDDANTEVVLFDAQGAEITRFSANLAGFGGCIRTCQGTQRFWIAYASGVTRLARYVEDDGTLGTAHTLTAIANVFACAANNDETILFHVASGTNAAIRQWDLVNDVALANLVAGIVGYAASDILVLSDDSILVCYSNTGTQDVIVRRYDAAGATLNTYTFGTANEFPAGTLPRLAYAIDEPTSFWIWRHKDGANEGLSVFENVAVATAVVTAVPDTVEYETGVYNRTVTATPEARFGISFSCPFWIQRAAITGTVGRIVVVKETADGDTTSFDFTAGGGLSPTSFSLADGDEQAFEDLPVGSGYSVSETVVSGWTSTGTSSNGTIDNIVVADGETTTVTFVNVPITFPNWLGSRVTRYPRRLIRSPHVSANGNYVRLKRLQIDMQPGMAEPTDGVPRDVQLRVSHDGGNTWSSFRTANPGAIGAYLARVQWWQVGFGRDIIIELVDHLPNTIVQGWLDADDMGR